LGSCCFPMMFSSKFCTLDCGEVVIKLLSKCHQSRFCRCYHSMAQMFAWVAASLRWGNTGFKTKNSQVTWSSNAAGSCFSSKLSFFLSTRFCE
jgi:hypothetical protein